MTTPESPWTPLATVPVPGFSQFSQYAVVFNLQTKQLYACLANELLQYSFRLDSWERVELEPPLQNKGKADLDYREPDRPFAAIDCDTNTIYVWFPECGSLTKIQLFEHEKSTTTRLSSPGYLQGAPKGIIIDNELHVIGDNRHLKYNAEFDEFELVHRIQKWFVGQGMAMAGGKLLVFGGLSLNELPLSYGTAAQTAVSRTRGLSSDGLRVGNGRKVHSGDWWRSCV